MQLKFTKDEAKQMILSAIRSEWPNMIGANETADVTISNYDGVTVDISVNEEEPQ